MTDADKVEELAQTFDGTLSPIIPEDHLKVAKFLRSLSTTLTDQAERIEALLKLISSFDAAIQHIAAPLGIVCGGVDTVNEINPETGKPFGHGGHTGWVLTDRIKKMLAVVEAAQVGHYQIVKGHCGCGLCTALDAYLSNDKPENFLRWT